MRLKLGTYKNIRNKIEIVKIYPISDRKFIDYIKTTSHGEVYGGERYPVEEFEDFLFYFGYKYVEDGIWD